MVQVRQELVFPSFKMIAGERRRSRRRRFQRRDLISRGRNILMGNPSRIPAFGDRSRETDHTDNPSSTSTRGTIDPSKARKEP